MRVDQGSDPQLQIVISNHVYSKQKIKNTMQSIAQMQDAMEMLQMLRELFPDAFSGNGDPMDLFSALQGMNLF